MSTFVQYVAPGDQRLFSVPFPYISTSHVKVEVNGFLQVVGADYEWSGSSAIEFRHYNVPLNGMVIRIRRETPIDDLLVVFQNGSTLTEGDLNTATRQLFYLSQEVRDKLNGYLENGLARLTDGTAVTASQMIEAITQEILSSDLLSTLNTRITDIDTNAESILQQTVRLDQIQNVVDTLLEIDGVGIATYVLNETQQRIIGDEALAATIALIGAESSGGTAFILNLDSVMASPTVSLATKFSQVEAGVADANAAIATEATARAAGDSANASAITTLQATVNGHTSSIQTISTVVSGTGGLTAQYMVKTDVNGYISGFGLYNQGAASEFIVLADKFAVVTPGQTPKVPFAVVGGTVYMQNVVIGGALIDDLSIGTLKILNNAITEHVTTDASDGSFAYPATTQPAAELAGLNCVASYTSPSNTNSQVVASWMGQANISNTTSGTAVGYAVIKVRVFINGSETWTREMRVESYTTADDYALFAGTRSFLVPAGQTIQVFLQTGRTFSTSGASPAQTMRWRGATVNLTATKR